MVECLSPGFPDLEGAAGERVQNVLREEEAGKKCARTEPLETPEAMAERFWSQSPLLAIQRGILHATCFGEMKAEVQEAFDRTVDRGMNFFDSLKDRDVGQHISAACSEW